MSETIHPTAVIHPEARLGLGVRVGPFCVVDAGVELGEGSELGPYVHLTGKCVIGKNNRFHTGCVIGDLPQDLRFSGGETRVVIGEANVFREHVTIHRSNKPTEDTLIGSNNLLMAGSHVGHNSAIGNHNVIANGALIAGHVTIGDRVFISGNCLVHQFTRIGTLALMQGGAGISKDLPPYMIATGHNTICGLNTIGLRRAGISSADRLELRKLYHHLFRTRLRFAEALAQARSEPHSATAKVLLDFLAQGKKGFCSDGRRRFAGSDESSDA